MRVFSFFLFFAFFLSSCDNNEEQVPYCSPIIISQELYQDLVPNQVNVTEVALDEDCLTVTMAISGCDNEHTINMISDGEIAESFPVQITFDFEDLNPQDCEALFMIDRQFDLSELRDLVEGDISIRFRNSDKSILYN